MKFWRALERLSGGAVMWEWSRELGTETAMARPFLRIANDAAKSHPCTNVAGCGCPHRIEEHGRDTWVAVCDGDEWCPPISVEAKDLLVYAADTRVLCAGISRCLRLGAPGSGRVTAARVERVGTYGPARSELYLMFPADSARMMREVERLFGVQPDPFLVLTPTGVHCTSDVETMLRRQSCMHIALSAAVGISADGALSASGAVAPLLKEFERRLAERPKVAPLLEGLHRKIDAGHAERAELRSANARLVQMHGEGMFAFAKHIDREAREIFLAVMAGGDIAKAARELDMRDSTLRSKLEKWPKRGKAYAALAEIVRWRKSIKGQAGMEFAKREASGAERDVDFPALIRDTVAELEEMAPENWEERCADLADALRKAVS
jgi:hypothetical protein